MSVSAGEDKEIKIWNIETNEEVCVLSGHKAKVTALHFSDGGRFVFSGDGSGLLLVSRAVYKSVYLDDGCNWELGRHAL